MKLIHKDILVAEIEKRIKGLKHCHADTVAGYAGEISGLERLLSFLDTLEVKIDEDKSLEKFKSLQHITGDLHRTLEDWGYAPNLYFFDGIWHVSWISCEEGDSIKDFEGNTPEDAIDKACNWFHSTFCNS